MIQRERSLVEESNQSSFVFDLNFFEHISAVGVVVAVVVVVDVLQSQGKEEDESYL